MDTLEPDATGTDQSTWAILADVATRVVAACVAPREFYSPGLRKGGVAKTGNAGKLQVEVSFIGTLHWMEELNDPAAVTASGRAPLPSLAGSRNLNARPVETRPLREYWADGTAIERE